MSSVSMFMARGEKLGYIEECSLKQIVDKHILNHEKLREDNNDLNLLQRQEESGVLGILKLTGGPYWSYVLEDSSSSYKLPCVIIDKSSCVDKLINLLDCLIEITKGYIVTESYKKGDDDLRMFIYLQFSQSEVRLIKKSKVQSFDIIPIHWNQLILIVHVTSVVITNICTFCLVLVMLSDTGGGREDKNSHYLWIVLKNEQTVWNDLLIPNREYILHMTQAEDYFKTAPRSLRAVLGRVKGIHVFKEIIHHPEMWPTSQAVELPPYTAVSMAPSINTNRNIFNCQYSSAWWLSLNEALGAANGSIVTLWGEVVNVLHSTGEDKDGCSLCTKQKKNTKVVDDILVPDQDTWTNPWETPHKGNEFLLPDVYEIPKNMDGHFVPDKITKIIVLKDVRGGKIVSLYIKKQEFFHYKSLFLSGTILCAKFVHKRESAKRIPYFVSCALSSFEIVSDLTSIREVASSAMTEYGFPFKITNPGIITWGILDLWLLTKVSLKFEGERNPINNHNGTKSVSNSKQKFAATAVVKVERHTGDTVTVLFKDDHVKILLEVPDDKWLDLTNACKVTPLLYNCYDSSESGTSNIGEVFHDFCATRNLKKKRFHVSCRLLPLLPGEDEVYFCTSIGDADPEHLLNLSKPNVLSELLNKSFNCL